MSAGQGVRAQVWEVAGPEHFVAGYVQQPTECAVCRATDTRPMLAAVDPVARVVLGYYHKHHRKRTLERAGIVKV